MTEIKCYIHGTNLYKLVTIDTKKLKKDGYIENIITNNFKIRVGQFQVDNIPTEKQIINHNGYLTLRIINPAKDITFLLGNISIKINDCFNKDFNGIINQFNKNKVIFSLGFQHYLTFKLFDIKLPRERFYFNCIPDGTLVYIEPRNYSELNYNGFKFIFLEGETIYCAIDLLTHFFTGSSVSIKLLPNYTKLPNNAIISNRLQYIVQVFYKFHFFNTDGFLLPPQPHDYFTKVSEMKTLFSQIYSKDGYTLKPENVIIFYPGTSYAAADESLLISNLVYDNRVNKHVIYFNINYYNSYQQPIYRMKQPHQLNQYRQNKNQYQNQNQQHQNQNQNQQHQNQNQQHQPKNQYNKANFNEDHHAGPSPYKNQKDKNALTFEYPVVPGLDELKICSGESFSDFLEIFFIFEAKGDISITEKVPLDAKVSDIAANISKANKIEGKVCLLHEGRKDKRKIALDPSRPITDYLDEMASKDGRNILYVRTESKQIVKPSESPQKVDGENKQIEKPKVVSKSRFKPKIVQRQDDDDDDNNDDDQPAQQKVISESAEYAFDFGNKVKKLKLKNDSILIENEKKIKNLFEIDKNETIEYYAINQGNDDGDVKKIDATKYAMKKLKSKLIKIDVLKNDDDNDDPKSKNGSDDKKKYFYQINSETEIHEIELDSDAKIITLKKMIAELEGVQYLSNVKILFAGKDLLNDLVVDSLNIGTKILYVYIRSEEDILLMTAKALKV